MKIIKAKIQDVDKISRLIKKLDAKGFKFSDREKIANQISNKAVDYYLALDNKKAVGAIGMIFSRGSCQIYSIAVKVRRKGIGRKLVNSAISKCKNKKISKIWCWSLSKYRAAGFYRKLKFEEEILLKQQWQGMDCYLFAKLLK